MTFFRKCREYFNRFFNHLPYNVYLSSFIDLVNPKVIVTLGKKALEALKEIENHQLVLKQDVATFTKWNNRWIYPLYHPSPQVIKTGRRNLTQQIIDFIQLDYSYNYRIAKGIDSMEHDN